ncbi:MAG TPA: hypothetical protein VNJ08_06660 [Bacteriovoracaceae bacterium]|nr:hypothetical protein [Bacteriovoracaceae bacterium]
MMIQNSNHLLENLSEIEKQIQKFEKALNDLGIALDRDKLLTLVSGLRKTSYRAGEAMHKKNSFE